MKTFRDCMASLTELYQSVENPEMSFLDKLILRDLIPRYIKMQEFEFINGGTRDGPVPYNKDSYGSYWQTTYYSKLPTEGCYCWDLIRPQLVTVLKTVPYCFDVIEDKDGYNIWVSH